MRKLLAVVALFVIGLCSCTVEHEQEVYEGFRIVSLSPGITNTIIHAGYGDAIVGRSAFCLLADKSIPVVGDLREVDYERLLRLHPTDVFVQKTAASLPSHLVELSEQGVFRLHAYPMDRVTEIQDMYAFVHAHFGDKVVQIELLQLEESTLPEHVLIITQGSEGNAGLCFGKETYLDDMLQALGVENAITKKGWVSLSLEDIGRIKPELIIVVSDSKIKQSSLEVLRSLGFEVIPFEHEHVLVPSSYLSEVAEAMQQLKVLQ
jgi:ABC-type hemin transport system substrate-binding protein